MTTLSSIITPSNIVTASSTTTLTNKTLDDPILTLNSTEGTTGQVPLSQGAGLPPVWGNAGGGAWTFLSKATASNSATVVLTGIGATYDIYVITVVGVVGVSENMLEMFTSSDGGSTYATSYDYIGARSSAGTLTAVNQTANIAFRLSPLDIGNAAGETGANAIVYMYKPSAAQNLQVSWIGTNDYTDGSLKWMSCSGRVNSSADVDTVKFAMQAGNIATGTFSLYGIKNS